MYNLNANFFQNFGKIITSPLYMKWMFQGMGNTLLISIGATLIGLILGTIVAVVKIIPSKNPIIKLFRGVCNVYTVVFRGTPMALQLFIMAFAIFTMKGFPMMIVAILSFGINSGAYVSESIRAGILSVDVGQMEAGRSLGLSYRKTMIKIIIPQAIKNVIPAVGNEIIALIKETSIVSYLGEVKELTTMASIMAGGTHFASYLAPMVVAALFYLAIVYSLTLIIKIIERRLRSSDKR